MSNGQATENVRSFTLPYEIFSKPHLDIYAQMAYIVLRSYTAESALPTLQELAQYGRMTIKQTTKALQTLVELKIVSHKLFRQLIGDFADDRLSWAAKGLLSFFKDHPQIRLGELIELSNQSGEDEQSVRRALKELKRCGYLDEYPELSKIAN